jgi:hypothetical protein
MSVSKASTCGEICCLIESATSSKGVCHSVRWATLAATQSSVCKACNAMTIIMIIDCYYYFMSELLYIHDAFTYCKEQLCIDKNLNKQSTLYNVSHPIIPFLWLLTHPKISPLLRPKY